MKRSRTPSRKRGRRSVPLDRVELGAGGVQCIAPPRARAPAPPRGARPPLAVRSCACSRARGALSARRGGLALALARGGLLALALAGRGLLALALGRLLALALALGRPSSPRLGLGLGLAFASRLAGCGSPSRPLRRRSRKGSAAEEPCGERSRTARPAATSSRASESMAPACSVSRTRSMVASERSPPLAPSSPRAASTRRLDRRRARARLASRSSRPDPCRQDGIRARPRASQPAFHSSPRGASASARPGWPPTPRPVAWAAP
jgi:hypothetical protein